ncbi:MAG TPA: SDR family oxidoreductase [Chloroflexota bacterium]|nr:SDR family oxidoreductase [Chloroflexota bacterium]
MAVLVAGVGYIGAALTADLLRAGERVVGLDNGFATDPTVLGALARQGKFSLVEGSIASPRHVARAFARGPFSVVYLLAAQASAHPRAAPPRYTEVTNLTGPRVLLDAAVRHGVRRVVYASSMRVYGRQLPPVVDEATPYGPQSDLVHLSQIYGEKLLELYACRAGLVGIAVRLGIVYGCGPLMKTDYRFMTVPNKYCLQAVRGEPLEIHPEATAPLPFIHLADACAALQAAAGAPWPAGFHAANAVGEVCPVATVAAAVAQAAAARGLAVTVHPPAPAAAAPAVRVQSRLSALGWRPTRALAESLGAVLDYFQAREAGCGC